MRYKRFTIKNYRAIVEPIVIDIEKSSLTPIIGVNESGKTTILHAIFAFDHYNDELNDSGRHLKDVANLYSTSSPSAKIGAEVEITRRELRDAISESGRENASLKNDAERLFRRRILPETIMIERDLTTLKYSIGPGDFGPAKLQDALAGEIISKLPYILYFDDFRDKIPEQIEIVGGAADNSSGWLAIIEQLFKQTDSSFSVYKLFDLEDRLRKTVLAQVCRKLNETLTKEWQTFKLDDRESLKISIDFHAQGDPPAKQYITLDVVETSKGDDKYFHHCCPAIFREDCVIPYTTI